MPGRSRVAARAPRPWQTGPMPALTPFLPPDLDGDGQDAIVDGFISAQESQGRTLYPHQEEALLAIAAGDHVIAATPTLSLIHI